MTSNNFEKDLNESNKTLSFISSWLLNQGLINTIEQRQPCEECLHPPDIIIHQEETIYLEVKEDAMSMKTGNIFLEHAALKGFSVTCNKEKAIPFLCVIPYINPIPLLFILCDEFRQELQLGLGEGIVKTVSGGDKGGLGYIINVNEARNFACCLTTSILKDSQIQDFKEQFIQERFNSDNHFFIRYANFQ